MDEFRIKLKEFYQNLGSAPKMVLATSQSNRVTARMMSCIMIDGAFYFQTDKKLLKYDQIVANPMVALCIDNIQIEGTATIQGHPLDEHNALFAEAYENYYKGSYNLYTSLSDEVLMKITPSRITLWEYDEKKPYRVFFDIENAKYTKEYYIG